MRAWIQGPGRTGIVSSSVRCLRALAWTGLAWVLVGSPAIARACAVCTAGREEENQLAYLLTTIFMSALPLIAVGTLGFVLWRRFKALEAELEATRETEPRAVAVTAAVDPRA